MSESAWACPFCNHDVIIRSDDSAVVEGTLVHPLVKEQPTQIKLLATFCPNPDCKRVALKLELRGLKGPPEKKSWSLIRRWSLLPDSKAKSFPDFIPEVILRDYQEASLIVDLSPKSSATLARRCLQGMIRDFWQIRKRRLKDEIDALEENIEPQTWDAIDSVRKIGNIGAHMEADINVIVDVDPDEATLLISLIETLLADWYIARHNREERMSKIKALAEAKERERGGEAGTEFQPPPSA